MFQPSTPPLGLLQEVSWARRAKAEVREFLPAWMFLIYGALLENGGILLGFFHETNLKLTLVRPLVAPVATMVGWCIVLYMATFVVWQVRGWVPALCRRPLLSALLVGVIATMLDLQI